VKALTLALVTAVVGVLAVPTAAIAAPEPAGSGSKLIRVSKEQFRAARAAAKAERTAGRENARLAENRREFIAQSARKSGTFYVEDEVDVVEPVENLVVVLPRDMQVLGLAVDVAPTTMIAEMKADWGPDGGGATTGPGVGMEPYWSSGSSGEYLISFYSGGTRLATMLSNFKRQKLLNDGSGTYDWWAYSRKAWGQSDEISGLNWSVTGMYMWNFPNENIKPNLVSREDMAPGNDITGDCDHNPWVGSVQALGKYVGISFFDCDYYDVWYHPNVPGEYSMYMDQGALYDNDNREAAYAVTVKSKNGSSVWYNDVQRLEIALYTYPAKKCQAPTNNGGTCYV
jgi:hypothetical protein